MLTEGSRRDSFIDYVAARRLHLRRLAYALCGDWFLADDLVQTALAKAYVSWPRIERDGAEDAYVRRTLVRVAVDQSRRPWRRESPGLDGVERVAGSPTSTVDDRHDLLAALALLPDMQRRTVVLRHWWGLSVSETALDLGISEGTVKSHTSRALTRLNELLASEGTTS